MRWRRVVQLVVGIAILAGLMLACANRDHLSLKGMPVDLDSIAACFAASAFAAYVTTRRWHWFPAPFIAGLAGGFFGGYLGPYGFVYGTLIGLGVVVAMGAQYCLTSKDCP